MYKCPYHQYLKEICEVKLSDRNPERCNNFDSCERYEHYSTLLNGIRLILDDVDKGLEATIQHCKDTQVNIAFIKEHRKELF